jgi:hypothetical protein
MAVFGSRGVMQRHALSGRFCARVLKICIVNRRANAIIKKFDERESFAVFSTFLGGLSAAMAK